MSIQALTKAFSRRDLPALSRWVLVVLADFADGDGFARVRVNVLVERSGLSRATVRTHLASLIEQGALREVNPEGEGRKFFQILGLE